MRKLLCLLLLFFPLVSLAQNADSAWIKNNYVKRQRYIRMRDGVRLYTAIYMPKDSLHKTHPVLLMRTPYGCAPYGSYNWAAVWTSYFKKYFEEGYDIVLQDVRGKYMSEGVFVDVRPFNPNKKTDKDIDEASDAYDSIDWLIKNIPGNNGRVGIVGTSYLGFYATMAGLSGHPALKAISPQAPVTDWFMGDDFHHNGAFMLMDCFDFFVGWGFGAPRPKPGTNFSVGVYRPETDDSYGYYLRMGALPNFTRIADERKIAFWDDVIQHPNYDEWWKARNVRNYLSRIPDSTATLVVGGLFDAEDQFGALNVYKTIEHTAKNNNKLVFGPWYHGQWGGDAKGDQLGNIKFGSNTSEWYVNNIELPFFNYYLKGKGSVDSIAEATVFFTGENKWHKLQQWPPAGVQPTAIFLTRGGKLSFNKPVINNSYEEYVSDPAKPVPYSSGISPVRTKEYMDDDQRFAGTRTDVLSFETGPLTDDITLAGPLIADLKVSISTTDADFVVKLIDVFPDDFKYTGNDSYVMNGYEMLVKGDVFRGRYRNSFLMPGAFVPGKISQVKYTLNDVAHTFKKGHRIMVQVQSSWFPLVDRNPQQFIDIYHAKDTDFIKSTIRVYTSATADSKIILPLLK